MTAQRARAYFAVTELLNASELAQHEQDRVREAADSLVLCRDLHADETARAAIVDMEALARELAERERWSKTRAGELVWAVLACGPHDPVIRRVAA